MGDSLNIFSPEEFFNLRTNCASKDDVVNLKWSVSMLIKLLRVSVVSYILVNKLSSLFPNCSILLGKAR